MTTTERESAPDLPSLIKSKSSKYDAALTEEAKGQKSVRVTYYLEMALSEAQLITAAALAFKETGQIVAENDADIDSLQLTTETSAVDAYGRTSREEVLQLALPKSELRKVQWDTASSMTLLNLADVKLKLLGPRAAQAFCEDNFDRARRFCVKAMR